MVTELVKDSDLEQLIERSQRHPVLIFKHSTRCPISDSAYQEFLDFTRATPHIDTGLVLVVENRALSNAIAKQFGIRHESPQAIVVRDGRPTWHASHFGITIDALNDALNKATA